MPAAPPRAAAFFDLDKTLMAGSSGVFFARAAYETGMISRSRLVRDVYENLRFRLLGSTDDRADDVRKRVGEMIAGVPRARPERLSPRVLAGVLPRLYPQMLERAYAHQDAGRAGLHPHRRLAGDGRPARARARLRRRSRLALGDRRRPLHRAARRAVQLPRGQGALDARARRARAASTWRLLRLLGLRVRPADAARRRPRRWSSTPTPSCGGSPPRRAGRWSSWTGSAGA